MRRIGDILKTFLATRLSGENERAAELVEACRAILGPLAAHARVRDIRGATLLLEVDHPGWGQMVALRQQELLKSLGERFPESGVSRIRIVSSGGARSGGAAAGAEASTKRRAPGSGTSGGRDGAAPGGAETTDEIEGALSQVHDRELRRSLRALYERADDSGRKRP